MREVKSAVRLPFGPSKSRAQAYRRAGTTETDTAVSRVSFSTDRLIICQYWNWHLCTISNYSFIRVVSNPSSELVMPLKVSIQINLLFLQWAEYADSKLGRAPPRIYPPKSPLLKLTAASTISPAFVVKYVVSNINEESSGAIWRGWWSWALIVVVASCRTSFASLRLTAGWSQWAVSTECRGSDTHSPGSLETLGIALPTSQVNAEVILVVTV